MIEHAGWKLVVFGDVAGGDAAYVGAGVVDDEGAGASGWHCGRLIGKRRERGGIENAVMLTRRDRADVGIRMQQRSVGRYGLQVLGKQH